MFKFEFGSVRRFSKRHTSNACAIYAFFAEQNLKLLGWAMGIGQTRHNKGRTKRAEREETEKRQKTEKITNKEIIYRGSKLSSSQQVQFDPRTTVNVLQCNSTSHFLPSLPFECTVHLSSLLFLCWRTLPIQPHANAHCPLPIADCPPAGGTPERRAPPTPPNPFPLVQCSHGHAVAHAVLSAKFY
jgi:hypothetical protein